MVVNVVTVAVHVRVLIRRCVPLRGMDAAEVERAEQDQHQRDAKLQAHPELFRNDNAEKNNRPADDEQRQAVTDAPEDAGPGRVRMLRWRLTIVVTATT